MVAYKELLMLNNQRVQWIYGALPPLCLYYNTEKIFCQPLGQIMSECLEYQILRLMPGVGWAWRWYEDKESDPTLWL